MFPSSGPNNNNNIDVQQPAQQPSASQQQPPPPPVPFLDQQAQHLQLAPPPATIFGPSPILDQASTSLNLATANESRAPNQFELMTNEQKLKLLRAYHSEEMKPFFENLSVTRPQVYMKFVRSNQMLQNSILQDRLEQHNEAIRRSFVESTANFALYLAQHYPLLYLQIIQQQHQQLATVPQQQQQLLQQNFVQQQQEQSQQQQVQQQQQQQQQFIPPLNQQPLPILDQRQQQPVMMIAHPRQQLVNNNARNVAVIRRVPYARGRSPAMGMRRPSLRSPGLRSPAASPEPRPARSPRHDAQRNGHSYIGLIGMAILSSPEKKMLLNDIYTYIETHYPIYRSKTQGWRNSIRHNLSLNECFYKSDRPTNQKGHYWTIHEANMADFMRGDFRRKRAQRQVRRWRRIDLTEEELAEEAKEGNGPLPPLPEHFLRSLAMHKQIDEAKGVVG